MAEINIAKATEAIEQVAENLGIDLSAYGNASPVKLIMAALTAAADIMQQTTKVALTEQNPLTATELQSKFGLAALAGLNVTSMMKASIGKVTVNPMSHTATVGQYARLRSYDNVDYYVVLPSEAVKFTEPTELIVKQGVLKTLDFVTDSDKWNAFELTANNFIDTSSIQVYANGTKLKLGFKLDEEADAYIRPSYTGKVEVVLSKTLNVPSGTAIKVDYAECIGVEGDNVKTNERMRAQSFAFEGDIDISEDIQIYISEPIIGGTDFATFDNDITNEILLGGRNNLIGNESQLVQYLSRFKQYSIRTAKVSDGVFAITMLKSLPVLAKSLGYWQAAGNLTPTGADVQALNSHISTYSGKSIDMAVAVKAAKQENCKVVVNVNMTNAEPATILATVEQYLLSRVSIGTYEVAGLYRELINVAGVNECKVSYEGNVNSFGTAMPSNDKAMLICTAADITVNGNTIHYGTYAGTGIDDTDTTVRDVTVDYIQGIK